MGLLIMTDLKSDLKNVILVLQTLICNSSLVTPDKKLIYNSKTGTFQFEHEKKMMVQKTPLKAIITIMP